MAIESIKFGGKGTVGDDLELVAFESSEAGLKRLALDDRACAYVVRKRNLPELIQWKDCLVDCGQKRAQKGLASHLTIQAQGKILCIDGNYEEAARCRHGVRKLLQNAEKKGIRQTYMVGIEDAIFDQLKEISPGIAGEGKIDSRKSRPVSQQIPLGVDSMEEELLEGITEGLRIPLDLKDEYRGTSTQAELVRAMIFLASKNRDPVLILGDTGTGKEIVAKQIHRYSIIERDFPRGISRLTGPFVAVNCSGLPAELLELELFGYVPGAFTDARKDGKTGLWELAKDGTLFLDEVGDLSLPNQAKILRALEDGKIRKIGAEKDTAVNARIIAATNCDLRSMMQTGDFREDLFHRLQGMLIRTPTLRDHREDIVPMAEFLWGRITGTEQKSDKTTGQEKAVSLSPEILASLRAYDWPGNVRELKSVLGNLHHMFPEKKELTLRHLQIVFYALGQGPSVERRSALAKSTDQIRVDCWRHLRKVDEAIRAIGSSLERWRIDGKRSESLVASFSCQMEGLEILCRDNLLFGTQKSYEMVLRWKDKMKCLCDLMRNQPAVDPRPWGHILEEEMQTVLKQIFRSIEKLLQISHPSH